MRRSLPLFPLNTVLFPGMTLPLHVFEERYRALVRDLQEVDDPADRLFGTVAIREGFEVSEHLGTEPHGTQSLYRTGCVLQLTDVEENPDGTFEVLAVARGRLRLDSVDTGAAYLTGGVELLADEGAPVSRDTIDRALSTFDRYRERLSELHGSEVLAGDLPQDATYLSWTLAGTALLPLPDRQSLLEAEDTQLRLAQLTRLLRDELRAMQALPSLPAVDVARTGWSPN